VLGLELPSLSPAVLSLFRAGYGVLLLLTLVQVLPQAGRFFVSERWRGYAKSSRLTDLVQNPLVMPAVLLVWVTCAVLLIAGHLVVTAAVVNLMFCWYFFIAMRWRSLTRGMGAPGFMTCWLAMAVTLLEISARHDAGGAAASAVLFALKTDFAVIMLCAGTYKVLAGYPKNEGMELGIINPWWGYWGRWYRQLRPSHPMLRTMNHLAYGTEIVAAVLMLIPSTSFVGALLIFGSFAWIATQIRLGFLCEMVMLAALLFIPTGHPLDRWLAGFIGGDLAGTPMPEWSALLLAAAALTYVALLPLAKAGQYWNFLARRRLPDLLQSALDRYTNAFGIIIWRVFSADHTNFFGRIWAIERDGARRPLLGPGAPRGLRYRHVGEYICLVSIFTTLKYYPGNDRLFEERLVRYARTLPRNAGEALVFEYVALRKEQDRFVERSVTEIEVDPDAAIVVERTLDPALSPRAATVVSPIHEAARPGTYAPVRSDR